MINASKKKVLRRKIGWRDVLRLRALAFLKLRQETGDPWAGVTILREALVFPCGWLVCPAMVWKGAAKERANIAVTALYRIMKQCSENGMVSTKLSVSGHTEYRISEQGLDYLVQATTNNPSVDGHEDIEYSVLRTARTAILWIERDIRGTALFLRSIKSPYDTAACIYVRSLTHGAEEPTWPAPVTTSHLLFKAPTCPDAVNKAAEILGIGITSFRNGMTDELVRCGWDGICYPSDPERTAELRAEQRAREARYAEYRR